MGCRHGIEGWCTQCHEAAYVKGLERERDEALAELAKLRAAPAVPEGYKLMPLDPPDELLAVWLTPEERSGGRTGGCTAPWQRALRLYKTMLARVPDAPTAQPPGEELAAVQGSSPQPRQVTVVLGDQATPEGRLATLISEALGTQHPAMDDLAALLLRDRPSAAPEAPMAIEAEVREALEASLDAFIRIRESGGHHCSAEILVERAIAAMRAPAGTPPAATNESAPEAKRRGPSPGR